MGQVAYSEYMQLYEAFAETKINYEDEIVISNAISRNKDKNNYWDLMRAAFNNISRMMKNNSLLFMYFHDSNLKEWKNLINMLKSSDLVFITSMHVNKSKLTLKSIIDPKKTMNGESLLVFQKIDHNNWRTNTKNVEEIVDDIKEHAIQMIDNSENGLSSAELYDNGILELIIKNDYLDLLSSKYKDLIDIFEKFLDWDINEVKWKKKAD